jgi:hypothetical protein
MKTTLLTLLCVLVLATTAVCAENPGKHPLYLQALADLRHARALVERPTDSAAVANEEKTAIAEIDAAISEIKKAAIDDGKDLKDHPPIDAKLERKGRFHQALELLAKARSDIRREEDNPAAAGLRERALLHVDEAFVTISLHLSNIK